MRDESRRRGRDARNGPNGAGASDPAMCTCVRARAARRKNINVMEHACSDTRAEQQLTRAHAQTAGDNRLFRDALTILYYSPR